MADDGAWAKAVARQEPDDARTRRAVAELRLVLSDLQARPLPPQSAAALAQALEALARRLDAEAGRRLELEARVQSGMDHVLEQLASVRAAQAAVVPQRDPLLLRVIFVGASLVAAVSVVGAGAAIVGSPQVAPRAVSATIAASGAVDLRASLRPEPPARRTGADLPALNPIAPVSNREGDDYAAVAAALERGEALALPRLTGLAQAGDSRAQIHLASLYEAGVAGVPRDLAAARLWTRRAAQGGDRLAMHNLGLFLADGEGGARDYAEAATWFRRAANRGVVDSQFNLGLLYEAGRGVEKNLREAYRWFAVAANAGDATAREKQVEIEARLTPAERAGLDGDVAAYRPGAAPTADLAQVIPPAASLAETQALLARRGYYVGPIDGVASPVLRAATSAYLRDHPEVARGR
ncbi:hypothetical protein [uncultured Phenylobacterium sp.]|uniref:tetratricopeptide repeat protein n=1 Tax=uncultured Phenylobacterium sp. TaxID=349273 RepID=UPI0025CDF113|nr:hypothetical protein [uncultured Phenylobacterium sp.]